GERREHKRLSHRECVEYRAEQAPNNGTQTVPAPARRRTATPGQLASATGSDSSRASRANMAHAQPPRTWEKMQRRSLAERIDRPAVAPCPALDVLRAMTPTEARQHVHGYLHDVMPARKAEAFEALSYCWELHLVELEELCLIRTVELSKRKLGHYRAVLRSGGGFPPLIGLGGDGKQVTENVLLCDGYHRAMAMRDVGMHFVWMWLAVGTWQPSPRVLAVAHRSH